MQRVGLKEEKKMHINFYIEASKEKLPRKHRRSLVDNAIFDVKIN
jgi:hypothetical protein